MVVAVAAVEVVTASGAESFDDDDLDDDPGSDDDDDLLLIKSADRTKDRRTQLTRSVGTVHNLVDLCKDLQDEDYIIFRILKPRKSTHPSWTFGLFDNDDDDTSLFL